MSLKLKVLGLGLLAVMATSAFAVMNANAKENGDAEIEGPPTVATPVTIVGAEGVGHRIHLYKHNETEPIGCDEATYKGTVTTSPVTSITVAPTYGKCYTTSSPSSTVTPTMEGCEYRFTVEKGGTNGTVDLDCPAGQTVRVHHSNCNITVPSVNPETGQPTNQNLSGVHYTTITDGGKHALTIHINVTIHVETHEKICVFLGTKAYARMKGTVKVWAEDAGVRRHLTTT